MEDGQIFNAENFKKRWIRASKRTGVPYRKPYTTRHTFAAWAFTLRIDPNRLVSLMGHGAKTMVYEVYGSYVEGLEKDRAKIRELFGEDFS